MNIQSVGSFEKINTDLSRDAHLCEENERLRIRLAESEAARQEVVTLNRKIESQLERAMIVQGFVLRVVQMETAWEIQQLICETACKLLECEVAMVWFFTMDQDDPQCLTQSGFRELSAGDWRETKAWAGKWQARHARHDDAGWGVEHFPSALGLADSLVRGVRDCSGGLLAVMIVGNFQARKDGVKDLGSAFKAKAGLLAEFALQIGALHESIRRQLGIALQNERIRISEERLSMALAGSNVGWWDWDMKTDSVYFSEQLKRQLGFAADEMDDDFSDWLDRLHPDDLEGAMKRRDEAAAVLGGRYNMTLRMRHREGHWVLFNTVGFNVSNPETGEMRMIGTHIDVTEFKALERKLLDSERKERMAKEVAEQENHTRSLFIAAVSHEIRTPLNGIMGVLQLLRDVDDEQQRQELLDRGDGAGRWLVKIIGESLDSVRFETGKIKLNEELSDLRRLLGDLEKSTRMMMKNLNVDLRWIVDSEVPTWVKVDPVRLRQILVNLTDNALRFTPKGFVAFEAHAAPDCGDGKRLLNFSVTDSGIGFSKDFSQIIFEPFTQAVHKSDAVAQGVGLGLVITKKLVTAMEGEIRVISEPGVGSRFDVTLTLETAPPPAIQDVAPHPKVTAALPKFKGIVLLVEDDETSSALGKMMMERLGLEVEVAMDGGEALEKLASKTFDVVFMDCWMPVKNGIAVTRELMASKDSPNARVPIIALTANSSSCDAAACRDAGMVDFMTKPLLFEDLVRVLRQFLSIVEG